MINNLPTLSLQDCSLKIRVLNFFESSKLMQTESINFKKFFKANNYWPIKFAKKSKMTKKLILKQMSWHKSCPNTKKFKLKINNFFKLYM